MTTKFLLKEKAKLEGSFKVIIQTEKPLSLGSTVLLKYGQNKCVALVDSINPPDSNQDQVNQILIDRFLKYCLGGPKDSRVETESTELWPAEKAEIYGPSEWIGNVHL